jgi:enamine deaminase RidA (YjgF/YER057c/UK114 family)
MTPLGIVNPESLGAPQGFSHGVIATGGRVLFVAGQAGWSGGGLAPDFATQFARALDQVLKVVEQAGGQPSDIARLTIYVTDLNAYKASREALGQHWKARLGRYYPATTLVEVKGLVDEGAVVEIEETAVIGASR